MDKKMFWSFILIISIGALLYYGFYNRNYFLGNKLETEKLEKRVNDYISRIDSNLEIGDIFIYSDTDYYFSIKEKDYSSHITRSEAVNYANNYIKNNMNNNLSVTDEGHELYGYYTFHVIENEDTVGMISVNEYTGEVWYHNWHGTLIEVISHHNE